MNDSSVVFKAKKNKLTIQLDQDLDFEKLKTAFQNRLRQEQSFFNQAQMNIEFEGRELTLEEKKELCGILQNHTKLEFNYILDNQDYGKITFSKEEKVENVPFLHMIDGQAQIYNGTIRSGQLIESNSSIIILGDINPGGKAVSSHNIIVMGNIRGTVYAGAAIDKRNAFIIALNMQPIQLSINNKIARSPYNNVRNYEKEYNPQIAYEADNRIVIENIQGNTFNHLFSL